MAQSRFNPSGSTEQPKNLTRRDDERPLRRAEPTPLELAGRAANRAAGRHVFQRYMSEKSANTLKRQARDLELFAEYLLEAQIPLLHGADFQNKPAAWQGISWGIVEGFVQWQLQEGYAVSSVNARLTTVRVYAGMAARAGFVDPREMMLIKSVNGFSRQGALNVDEQRQEAEMPTRIDEVTYDYRPEGARRRRVVTRRSTKKCRPRLLSDEEAERLKQLHNTSPQGQRDVLLLCLLLDHGLRASEAALLTVSNFDIDGGEMTFYRPKVKGTDQEWTTHKLTEETLAAVTAYIKGRHPAPLLADTPLLLATTRLLKDGTGGELKACQPLSRVRISERVKWLGQQLGMAKLSAHDCRHYCATKMARLGYGLDELMAWLGWTSAQTAMRYVTAAEVQERYRG
jgi:integrase